MSHVRISVLPGSGGRDHDGLLGMGAADDAVFSPDEVEETAKVYGTQSTIFPNMAHDMMLEPNWRGVADHILDWLNNLGVQLKCIRN